jgi:hypothetical protein
LDQLARRDLTGEYSLTKNFAIFANLRNLNDPTDDQETAGPSTPEEARSRQPQPNLVVQDTRP